MKTLLIVSIIACSIWAGDHSCAQVTGLRHGLRSVETSLPVQYVQTMRHGRSNAGIAGLRPDAAGAEEWRFLLEPYFILPNIKGSVGIGNLPDASVDADPGDVFSHFKFGAMLYLEASKGRWSFSSDLLYMKLGEDAEPTNIVNSGSVDFKQLGWELAALRKFLPWLEGGLGFNLNSIDTDVDLAVNTPGGGASRSGSLSETWVDPTLIARVKYPFDDKWLGQVRGNVGGFGLGSELSWQVQGYVGYRFSKLFNLSAGYRWIGADYENGSGEDRFLYDLTTSGAVIRLGFNF